MTAQDSFAKARDALGRDDVRAAKKHLEEAIRIAPDDYDVIVNAASIYVEMDRFTLAEPLFEPALVVDAECLDAYRARGLALLTAGKVAKAHADLVIAERLAPDDEETKSALARAAAARPVRVAGALPIVPVALSFSDGRTFDFPVPLDRTVELEGDLSPRWAPHQHVALDDVLIKSRAHAIEGDLNAAIDALEDAEPAADDHRLAIRRGLLAFAVGDDALSASALGSLRPDVGAWMSTRALALALVGRAADGIDGLSYPDMKTTGLAWLVSGAHANARRDLTLASTKSRPAEVLVHLGVAHLALGDRQAATSVFAEALSATPIRSPDKRWRPLVLAAAALGLALANDDVGAVRDAAARLRRGGDPASGTRILAFADGAQP